MYVGNLSLRFGRIFLNQRAVAQVLQLRKMSQFPSTQSKQSKPPLSQFKNQSPENAPITPALKDNISSNQSQSNPFLSSEGYNSFKWMSKHGPEFFVKGDQIQVLTEPDEFYQILKLKTKNAKKRITLASLYLGTGSLEKELVSSIEDACVDAEKRQDKNFEVNILLDYTRGSRGPISSRMMLESLLENHDCVNVSLYHTPDLRGILKKPFLTGSMKQLV